MLKLKSKNHFHFNGVLMKNNNGYNTKQRELLLMFLKKSGSEHITVQEISAFLTNEGNPMGVSTIYRQLDRLVEQGIVRKYILDGRLGACYQYIENDSDCQTHFHLKCVSCGKLIHIDCNHLNDINDHIFQQHGFCVDNSKTVFYGICHECSLKKG